MQIEKLIGQHVYNRMQHWYGVITSVSDNIVVIRVHGEEKQFAFPGSFTSILECEDEELQREIEKSAQSFSFDQFKKRYMKAVQDEINFIRQSGGKRYTINDGELLYTQSGDYVYLFETDSEYHFPDGTPIRLYTGEGMILAYVNSCEEFTIIIRTSEFLGKHVHVIDFSAEQWQLLEVLTERLAELQPKEDSIAFEIACMGSPKIEDGYPIARGQNAAYQRALKEPITFIWGPPGTGKTQTLSDIARK